MNYRFIPVPRDTKSMFCHRQSQYARTNRIFRIIDTSFDTFFDHPPRAPYSAASIFRTFIHICQFQPAFFLSHHPLLFSDSPFIDRPFLKSNPTFRMWMPVGSVISVPPHPGLLRLIRDSMNNMLKIHSQARGRLRVLQHSATSSSMHNTQDHKHFKDPSGNSEQKSCLENRICLWLLRKSTILMDWGYMSALLSPQLLL